LGAICSISWAASPPGAQLLFFVTITALSYTIHPDLTQPQCSAVALVVRTRNIAAVFAAFFGITNAPPGMFVMIILVVPLALIAARLFARQRPNTGRQVI